MAFELRAFNEKYREGDVEKCLTGFHWADEYYSVDLLFATKYFKIEKPKIWL